jgi:hypothetical protein
MLLNPRILAQTEKVEHGTVGAVLVASVGGLWQLGDDTVFDH